MRQQSRSQSRCGTSSSQTRLGSSQQLRAGCSASTFTDFEGGDDLSEREEVSCISSARPPVPRRGPGGLWDGPPMGDEEEKRDALREELIRLVGGSAEAFRMIDITGSGRISLTEFSDGMARIGIPWQELTGYRWILDLFALFDQNRDGVVDLEELFPVEARKEDGPRRLNTPDFWDQWCDWSDDFAGSARFERKPMWGDGPPKDELNRLYKAKRHQEGVSSQRRWMSSMFRRLKNRGKSDAQCRECIAQHLPRGSGPKDRHSVQTFSEVEVTNCKRAYQEGLQNPVRSIQKEVFTMREQRQQLAETRQQLFTITGPALVQYIAVQRAEEERKSPAAAVLGLSGFNLLHHAAPQATTSDDVDEMAAS